MGGLYGKLLITAYILFDTILLGFILMCVVFGRKGDKTPSPKVKNLKITNSNFRPSKFILLLPLLIGYCWTIFALPL
jgi:hypothetical protein